MKLSTGKAKNFDAARGMTKPLRAAWKAYGERASVDRRLLESQKRMKEVGREILSVRSALHEASLATAVPAIAAAPRTMKVGPNAPCPCGSGVKFKRCCMGKG